MGKTTLFVFMLVLVLFASEESVMKVTEAKMCESTGRLASCAFDRDCSHSCEKDGFIDGHCDGIRRRCVCRKAC
ncbi:putative knottin, scorpion toxin [Helianthus anomalus]